VTQDQFALVSEKVFGTPEDNLTKNIELFGQTFTNVELVRQSWKASKATLPGREPTELQSATLPLRHSFLGPNGTRFARAI
jgi:hypothetical protein